jgi:hypothetical protein
LNFDPADRRGHRGPSVEEALRTMKAMNSVIVYMRTAVEHVRRL